MYACVHACIEYFYNVKIERLGHFSDFFSDAVESPPLVPGRGEIIEVDNLIK